MCYTRGLAWNASEKKLGCLSEESCMPPRKGSMPLKRCLRASDTQFPGGTRIWTKFGLGTANLVQNRTFWSKFGYFGPNSGLVQNWVFWSEQKYLVHIRTFGPNSGARKAKGPNSDAVPPPNCGYHSCCGEETTLITNIGGTHVLEFPWWWVSKAQRKQPAT